MPAVFHEEWESWRVGTVETRSQDLRERLDRVGHVDCTNDLRPVLGSPVVMDQMSLLST